MKKLILSLVLILVVNSTYAKLCPGLDWKKDLGDIYEAKSYQYKDGDTIWSVDFNHLPSGIVKDIKKDHLTSKTDTANKKEVCSYTIILEQIPNNEPKNTQIIKKKIFLSTLM
jgi:nucleoside phosphorylase